MPLSFLPPLAVVPSATIRTILGFFAVVGIKPLLYYSEMVQGWNKPRQPFVRRPGNIENDALRITSSACATVISASFVIAGTVPPRLFSNSSSAKNTPLPSTPSGRLDFNHAALNGGTGRGVTSGQSSGARGLASERIGAISGATASRAVKGAPSDHRSRSVRINEVCRYSSVITRRCGIHAEIAMAGTRTPERSNVKPICPGGAPASGGGAGGGGT